MDAVFHEESESVIAFKIRAINDELSSFFLINCRFSFCTKMHKMAEIVFDLYLHEDNVKTQIFFNQNDQQKKLYKS